MVKSSTVFGIGPRRNGDVGSESFFERVDLLLTLTCLLIPPLSFSENRTERGSWISGGKGLGVEPTCLKKMTFLIFSFFYELG